MSAWQIAGFAVCAAAMALILRRIRPEAAPVLIIAAGAITALMALPQLAMIVDGVRRLAVSGGLQNTYMTPLLKVAGISLLMDFASQTCRDAGEDGLALKVELAGRVMLIALALPVMEALLSHILSLSF